MRQTLRPLVAAGLAVATALVAACAGPGGSDLVTLNVGKADIRPTPVGDVAPGGELRWPFDGVPPTFNTYQVNGTDDETASVVGALLPRVFVVTPDGRAEPDRNYLLAVEVISRSPQVVRYVLDPRAVWSDGTPISWRDFEAQWKALNGKDKLYQAASTTGYDDIASVTMGRDDREVVVTFTDKFAEWQGLFSPLYPAAHYSTPTDFNTAWLGRIPLSAGPFVFQGVDPVTSHLTLTRNETWWGPKAKLDRIVFKPVVRPAYFEGLATNDLDFVPIGYDVALARQVRTLPDFEIRQSVNRKYQELLVNGGPGTVLADPRLRQALVRGLDRDAIARRAVGEIAPAVRHIGNHLYPPGHAAYEDNSEGLSFDPARADRALDTLGWRRQGDRRVQGTRPLQLRLVVEAGDPVGEQVGAAVAEQLDAIGVAVTVQPLDAGLKDLALRTGKFDLILDREQRSRMPLSTEVRRHYEAIGADVGSNYGRVFNPDVVERFGAASRTLDDLRRDEDANGLDTLLWSVVHSVPLFPDPGAYAVRRSMVNFGAPGLADIDYSAIGREGR